MEERRINPQSKVTTFWRELFNGRGSIKTAVVWKTFLIGVKRALGDASPVTADALVIAIKEAARTLAPSLCTTEFVDLAVGAGDWRSRLLAVAAEDRAAIEKNGRPAFHGRHGLFKKAEVPYKMRTSADARAILAYRDDWARDVRTGFLLEYNKGGDKHRKEN